MFIASLPILLAKDIRRVEVDSYLPDIPRRIHQAHIPHKKYLKARKNRDHFPSE
jgi:hypothetical protein